MTRKTKLHEIRDYVIIALAMIEGSIGLNIFLLPNHITMGGVGGIASILYWGFGIPASVSYLALNVFLLLIAFRILGYKFCLKTIYGVGIFALTTRLIETHTVGMTPLLHDQPFMATVIGAFFMGSSAGLGLSCNGSTGGSDTVAAMINKYWNISLGHAIMICDLWFLSGIARLGDGDLRLCLPLCAVALCRSCGEVRCAVRFSSSSSATNIWSSVQPSIPPPTEVVR